MDGVSKRSIAFFAILFAFIAVALFGASTAFADYGYDAGNVASSKMETEGYYLRVRSGATTSRANITSTDFSFARDDSDYLHERGGGAYGHCFVYKSNANSANGGANGASLKVLYPNVGTLINAANKNDKTDVDMEITLVMRDTYRSDNPDSEIEGNKVQIGVANTIERGFVVDNIWYFDMYVKFYKKGTSTPITVDSLWVTMSSLNTCEGFTAAHVTKSYVCNAAYQLNTAGPNVYGNSDAHVRSLIGGVYHVVPKSYLYEVGDVASDGTSRMYGFVGGPSIAGDHEALGDQQYTGDYYDFIDKTGYSGYTTSDGVYHNRTFWWRTGSVLTESGSATTTIRVYTMPFNRWRGLSSGVNQDASKLDMSSGGGAIWFVPEFAPMTSVVPEDPTKTASASVIDADGEVTYTITQRIGKRGSDIANGMSYDDVTFNDTLPQGLNYKSGSFRVYDQSNNDITNTAGQLIVNGRSVTYRFSQAYLDQRMSYDGGNIKFVLTGTADTNTVLSNNISTVSNRGRVTFNNTYALDTNLVTTKIRWWKATILKASDYPEIMIGNSAYSLADAEFKVTDSNGTNYGTQRTGSDGKTGTVMILHPTTLTIQETKAPAGHKLADPPSQFKVLNDDNAGQTFTFTFADIPISLSPPVIAKKVDADYYMPTEDGSYLAIPDGADPYQGDAGDFSGTKVRVDFYIGTTPTGTPAASAIFKANASGDIAFANATPVDGTSWRYRYGGKNILPVNGCVVVTEVEAPRGYLVDSTPRTATIRLSGENAELVPGSGWLDSARG